ncbi:MAG: SMP-30/gluconolactonase/LRE family protein [Desulfuromonadales bacterium]|nr:SMP-30/gluconolactonase/LRE family protein [Desulfuromonadales bacterium]
MVRRAFIVATLAAGLALLLLTGCAGVSGQSFTWRDESIDLRWPEPPDAPRIAYLRTLSGPKDLRQESSRSRFMTWLLGERQDELPLLTPFAVALAGDDLLWVADNGARMLYRFDLARRKIDYFQEVGGLRLFAPNGVAVDTAGNRVFLSDAAHSKIIVLDDRGRYLESWGPAEGFARPVGLAYDSNSGRLLVADAMGGQVFVFSAEGRELQRFGSRVNADGRFARPLAVAFGPAGEIVVLDALSFRVEVLDAQGELLASIGQVGDAAGYLARPKGLAVNAAGELFVSDAAFDNIQVFDLSGNLLMYWGGSGRGPGQFSLPAGLSVDGQGRLFVADWYNHRVQVFERLP